MSFRRRRVRSLKQQKSREIIKTIKKRRPNHTTQYKPETWARKVMMKLEPHVGADYPLMFELRTEDSVIGKLTSLDWKNLKAVMSGEIDGEEQELPIPAVAIKKFYEITKETEEEETPRALRPDAHAA